MPNFDAGRYFLTILAPIRSGGDDRLSNRHALRQELSVLPTALQTPATRAIGMNSPFAANQRTHLARFAVIDDLVFNGPAPIDPIWGRITGRDPIHAGPVDQLTTAYLMFTAEIDAVREDGLPLSTTLSEAEQDAVRDAYATTLWTTMEPALRRVFQYCYGFDEVKTAADFARFIARAQVETTMPFNDYYTTPLALPVLPLKAIAALVLVPLLVFVLALIGWLAHLHAVPIIAFAITLQPLKTLLWSLLATLAAVFLAYRYIMTQGLKPLPPAENSALPEVLKALYLQSVFTGFAEDQQGTDAPTLHAAFGRFLARHKPLEAQPTQPPGVIHAVEPRAIEGGADGTHA